MLLDRSQGPIRVLMGKRSNAHVFMPDLHVFPGGRRDPGDHRLPWAGELHSAVQQRLMTATGGQSSPARLRAIAMAALRELHEEAHVAVGKPVEASHCPLAFLPDLTNLRYIARAITPPGLARRFDTHFFALFADEAEIDPAAVRDSQELEDLRWIDVDDVSVVQVPDITEIILGELRSALEADTSLAFDRPVPFFHTRRGQFVRDLF
ncbi:NUDIX hydrolase [Pararhizobium capsulatum]|nr:NUDIX domain-containing protein [Pararhizobium capsulatum]